MSLLTHLVNTGVFALAFAIASLLLKYVYRFFLGPARSVPGPWWARVTSLPYKYYSLKGEKPTFTHSLHLQYGPMVRITPDEISVAHLPSVKEIHRISSHFIKAPWYDRFNGGQKPNMFSMRDVHEHRTRRSLLAGPLSENNLKKTEPIVNSKIERAIDLMANENSHTGKADVFKFFTFMATDIIGELTFGESFHMLDHGQPNQYYFDLKSISRLSPFRMELGPYAYLLATLRIQPFADAIGLITRFRNYAIQSVTRYEKIIEADPEEANPTLFSKLYGKKAEGGLSREDLIREGNAYIIAGSDTTATTSTFLIYHICRNTEVREKLLAELATLPDDFCWDDLRSLTYLNNAIQESLRLSGAVPAGLKRSVPAGGANLAGYQIPQNMVVSTPAHTLHRDSAVFPEPERFNPDRWLNPTPEMNTAFTAFGAGTRICIGMHLARDEMRYATAMFFKRFPEAKVLEDEEGMKQIASFVMAPKAGRCLVELGEKA